MSPELSISVAKLTSGFSFASMNVLSRIRLGVLPTKITLPPCFANSFSRARPVRVITVIDGSTMAL